MTTPSEPPAPNTPPDYLLVASRGHVLATFAYPEDATFAARTLPHEPHAGWVVRAADGATLARHPRVGQRDAPWPLPRADGEPLTSISAPVAEQPFDAVWEALTTPCTVDQIEAQVPSMTRESILRRLMRLWDDGAAQVIDGVWSRRRLDLPPGPRMPPPAQTGETMSELSA